MSTYQPVPPGVFFFFCVQYSPERSSAILLACCVLHNASLQSGLDAWTLERTDPLEPPDGVRQQPEERDCQAEELRAELILKHFSWLLDTKQSGRRQSCWCSFLIFCWFLLYGLRYDNIVGYGETCKVLYNQTLDNAGAATPFRTTRQEVLGSNWYFRDVFFSLSEMWAAATLLRFLYKWE